MLARIVTIHVRPEKMDGCIKIFRERNAPSIAAQPGFHHGHWWVDRATGLATSVTFRGKRGWRAGKLHQHSRARRTYGGRTGHT